MADDALTREIERRVEELGYELVELERAGDARRPILRLRIDRQGSTPETGVSLEDCTRVSRALEASLDERTDLASTYVLEVSSPGVERPLVRTRDFERFSGQEVRLKGRGVLADRAKMLEGELLGIRTEGEEELVRVRLPGGDEVEVPRSEIRQANLIYRWGGR